VIRACHSKSMQSAMRNLEGELAAIRDTYQGGRENDEETLEIHERQVEAMRRRDMKALAAVLDEHFRMLEENYAEGLNRKWEDLFGEVAEQTLTLGATPDA
jgi:DNA-binding GntR family transcriptional regulator